MAVLELQIIKIKKQTVYCITKAQFSEPVKNSIQLNVKLNTEMHT